MANNCSFCIAVTVNDPALGDRLCNIINNDDPEYMVIRTWKAAHVTERLGTTEGWVVTIEGLCPWTADYFWDPGNTLYGESRTVGERQDDDEQNRILASIPYLCKLWNTTASGWQEEWGCEVDGVYSCDAEGNYNYIDTWGHVCLEHMGDDSWDDALARAYDDGYFSGTSADEVLEYLESAGVD